MLPILKTIYSLLTDLFKPSKGGNHLFIHYMQNALLSSHREYVYNLSIKKTRSLIIFTCILWELYKYINAQCGGSANFILVQRVVYIITTHIINLNAKLNTTKSGGTLKSMILPPEGDNRYLGGNMWKGVCAVVCVIRNYKVRRAKVILNYVNCCDEISCGRLLFLFMVFTSRIIYFMKVKNIHELFYIKIIFHLMKSITLIETREIY
jgi:hypothetical protein